MADRFTLRNGSILPTCIWLDLPLIFMALSFLGKNTNVADEMGLGDPIKLGDKEYNQFISPLSLSVGFLDSASKMFFNPFSGNISMVPEYFSPRIPGGILADEMGLGKTVELLACIFSH